MPVSAVQRHRTDTVVSLMFAEPCNCHLEQSAGSKTPPEGQRWQ